MFLLYLTIISLSLKWLGAYYFFHGDLSAVSYPIAGITVSLNVCMAFVSLAVPRRLRPWFLLVLNGVLSSVIIADVLYFRNFDALPAVAFLEFSWQLSAFPDSAFALFRPQDIFFYLDLPFLALVAFYSQKFKCISSVHLFCTRCVSIVLLLVSVGYIAFFFHQHYLFFALDHWSTKYSAFQHGILPFHVSDVAKYIRQAIEKNDLSEEEKNRRVHEIAQWYMQKQHDAPCSVSDGIAHGHNVISIEMESAMKFLIDLRVNNQEVTPNLNRIANSSLRFENAFTQACNGLTSDAEFASYTSLIPLVGEAVSMRYANNSYVSLPAILKESGYSTHFSTAQNLSLWNRIRMFKTLGFDELRGIASFNPQRKHDNDRVLFQGAATQILKYDEPFFASFLTFSCHVPFTQHRSEYSFDVGSDLEGTLLGHYIKCSHYVDHQIGVFLQTLEDSGLMDRSILVMYGDHGSWPVIESTELRSMIHYKSEEEYLLNVYRVPLLIHLPDERIVRRIYQPVGHVDIAPLLASFLGVDLPIHMGRNVLCSSGGVVVTPQHYGFSGNAWTEPSGKMFSISTGEPYDDSSLYKKIESAKQKQSLYARWIFKNDLVPAILEEMGKIEEN